MSNAKIKEIFSSIQGEGPYVGYKQLFIRFCDCNLKCRYCDTEFSYNEEYTEYEPITLLSEVNKYRDIHSISLTGGEPLLSADFLKEFLPKINKEVYLETNATLADKFIEIKPFVNIVSADIKLESATGLKDTFELHDKFFEVCRGVETFAKIVFNENITDSEISRCCYLGKKYDIELILQPEMIAGHCEDEQSENVSISSNNNVITTSHFSNAHRNDMSVTSEFAAKILDKFLKEYKRVRLIPQVHKFLNVR